MILKELLSILNEFKKDDMVWVIQRDPRTKKEKKTMATVRTADGQRITVALKDDPNGKLAIDRTQMGPGKPYDIKPRIDEAFSKDMIAKYDPVLKVMNKMGIKFTEKPERWVNIKARVSESKITKLEEEIGFKLVEYTSNDIFGRTKKKSTEPDAIDGVFPQFDAKVPKEPFFILEMEDDRRGTQRYLCDGSGASTYIRFWAMIV